MYILIPVESDNAYEAKITTIIAAKKWAIVDFDAGKAQSIIFADDWRESGIDWFDFVILDSKFESYIDFMNEGMMCLCKRNEETIEELISAFAFKELDEVGL